MNETCRVLLISGSLRSGSTNTALLRTVEAVAPDGLVAVLYEGLGDLPLFNPDDDVDPVHPAVAGLRAQIQSADALLISTPEYAGALPGSFKNLLEWTVGGGDIYTKPVAWINASTSPAGAVDAHHSLRVVLGYIGAAIVESACVHVPVPRDAVGADGLVADPLTRERLAEILTRLAGYIAVRRDESAAEQVT
jgi:chromate reductase